MITRSCFEHVFDAVRILLFEMEKVIQIEDDDEPVTKSPESAQHFRGEIPSKKRPFYEINFDYFLNNPLDLSNK